MPEQVYETYARKRGTQDWHPVNWGGDKCYGTLADMTRNVHAMAQNFPHIEYRIKEVQHA